MTLPFFREPTLKLVDQSPFWAFWRTWTQRLAAKRSLDQRPGRRKPPAHPPNLSDHILRDIGWPHEPRGRDYWDFK